MAAVPKIMSAQAQRTWIHSAQDHPRAVLAFPGWDRETWLMTIRLAVVAIDAVDTHLVADFWAAALGWDSWPGPDGDGDGVTLAPCPTARPDPTAVPEGMPDRTEPDQSGARGVSIDVLSVPETKSVKNRLHFDVRPDGTTQADEVSRLLALGASRVDVGQGPDVPWVVLADPEGNEFCVLQRSVHEAAAAAGSTATIAGQAG